MTFESFEILWAPAALVAFYRLPMHSATIVDRNVIKFVEAGRGEVAWEAPYHHLRAGLYNAMLVIDREAQRVTVLRIYRARPQSTT